MDERLQLVARRRAGWPGEDRRANSAEILSEPYCSLPRRLKSLTDEFRNFWATGKGHM